MNRLRAAQPEKQRSTPAPSAPRCNRTVDRFGGRPSAFGEVFARVAMSAQEVAAESPLDYHAKLAVEVISRIVLFLSSSVYSALFLPPDIRQF